MTPTLGATRNGGTAADAASADAGERMGEPISALHVPAREPLAPEHPHDEYALVVRDLAAGYPGHPPAIDGINLRVPRGELVGLIGPNGAGKSTLFKAILGLIKPIRGEVLAFGQPIARAREQIAYMPQIEEVDWDFPVSVLDVVLMGRYQRFRPFARWTRADRDAAMTALDRVQLTPYAARQVGQLSGGQRRRVLTARAIARGARLLLLDEPFAGLDAAVQHDLIEILDQLARDGTAILVATHDLSCVANSCDEAICLNGRVIAQGPSAEVLTAEVLTETFQRHLLSVPRQDTVRIVADELAAGGRRDLLGGGDGG
ncbi:MAG: ABC transporter ATP-binding protein [Chloroflexi bacterium]|nr:ABC transporter ATP-binding protein [Chloroflexota bacterium]MDA1003909.1 ABC transporter ATP-binding protein [Chloroflexota bacterium]